MNHENRMTTLDAGFLQAEDSDRHVSLAIGGLALLAGPVPDQSVLRRTLGERMRACPRFSQRIQLHPFDIGPPEWVDDDDFDIARHVRRIGVPQPGGDAELHRLVAEVMAWRLDRSRPLWEIWVIEGLSEGRWAMLMKVHHCIADGIATAHMLAGLADGGAGAAFAERTRAAGPAAATTRPPRPRWTRGREDWTRCTGSAVCAGRRRRWRPRPSPRCRVPASWRPV